MKLLLNRAAAGQSLHSPTTHYLGSCEGSSQEYATGIWQRLGNLQTEENLGSWWWDERGIATANCGTETDPDSSFLLIFSSCFLILWIVVLYNQSTQSYVDQWVSHRFEMLIQQVYYFLCFRFFGQTQYDWILRVFINILLFIALRN